MEYSGKPDIFSILNASFQTEKNDNNINPEESTINPYLTKEYIPELEIIDKNI